ncbi:MAG TPA: NAD-glutamate dehydrogenase domain-containing protein [Longimicrobiales bacterium]|nr:NAD-glutamate dehydrogenase domain-containing protein [Longimicrobiales bacterium]
MADQNRPSSATADPAPTEAAVRGATGASSAAGAIGTLIDEACARLERLVEPAERELALTFTRLMFGKAPREFFHERSMDELAAIALHSFRFVDAMGSADSHVEVVDPEADRRGWHAPVTVIRTGVTERPFIVDTIRELLHDRELAIERFIYPVIHVGRNADGRVVELAPASSGDPRESFVYCEIGRVADADARLELRDAIAAHLRDVVKATNAFQDLLAALNETVARLSHNARMFPDRADEIKEIQAFLRWLRDGGLVFLGYRSYDIVEGEEGRALVTTPDSGLGILAEEDQSSYAKPVPVDELPAGLRDRVVGGPLLITSKTNARSTVHRRVRMDYIGVKKLDDEGRVSGEDRFLGLFTSQAYSEDAEQIPILRQKLATILETSGVIKGSHDYKEYITIFNSMPKEDLFLTSAEEIGAEIQAVLTLYHTHEVRVTVRPDPLRRGVSVMAILPKERFSGDIRKAIEQAFVERFQGEVLNYHLALGAGDQARLHFYISTTAQRIDEVDATDLELIVSDLIRSWSDRVREGLERLTGSEEHARKLARRYSAAFGAEYRAAIDAPTAERDILELEAMAEERRNISIRLQNHESGAGIATDEPVTEMTLYLRDRRIILSDFMPILENLGLRVIAMTPFDVGSTDVPDARIYVFAVQDQAARLIDLDARGEQIAEAVLAVRAGVAMNDSLNALVALAGLRWRQVDVLRAYAEYAFQLGIVPSRLALPTALRAHPRAAELVLEMCRVKFDPSLNLGLAERGRRANQVRESFIQALENVTALAEDRALRRLLALVEATLRTNYYLHGGEDPTRLSGGAPYLSLKFSAEMMEGFTRTGLLYEVWVHSARMSGVHLRGARVARGGIRHSDRPDDFRTEVLGLVRTQMVKNAVIVPGGSKGGFVVRPQRSEARPTPEDVTAQYQTLIRGLLDITDNLVAGEPARPPELLVYDDTDPYLVVAADKGTAHLSDVANGVAAEYDFWLGDAFASGGSHGYDHKEVGITAKGGWECVKRHFREMGVDIQAQPFTVAGIGDMSGDVFGNGMLLSREIRLVGAFDHRHIFVDPAPDAARSFAERFRLFHAGRTSWDDYDRSAMSEGGFIVPRGSKEVPLTMEAKQVLGIDPAVESMDGESLIRAILCAPVDLLWNGGIGTYVKAVHESHAEVGDSANDAVRIDATQLRARVVGEGGNLGFTQAGRVQAALRGTRLNTDALDNSGGVDMSDHEVNLKILLNDAVARGLLDQPRRNVLLEELTGDVTELVLADNRSQSLAVSLDELRAVESLEDFKGLMPSLERERLLDRKTEGLPSLEDLEERRAAERTLTRPELSVLLAYAKLSAKRHLLGSPLPDDPAAHGYLVGYFPARAVDVSGQESLQAHRLRREIVATQVVNQLVDLMGAAFVHRVMRDTGHASADVVRAWLVAARLSGSEELRTNLESLEGELPSAVVYRWLMGLGRVLERTTRWVLANVEPDVSTHDVIEGHIEGLAELRGGFARIVAGEERLLFEQRVAEIRELTEKHDLAERLITLRFLDQILEILRIASEAETTPVDAGRAYYRVSDLLRIGWLRTAIAKAAGDSRWEQRAAQGLVDDLGRAHRLLTAEVLREGREIGAAEQTRVERAIERVRERHAVELQDYLHLIEEIAAEGGVTLSALAVAVRELEHVHG